MMTDRDAIAELHDRYTALMDGEDYAALPTLLTDDAVFEGFGRGDGAGARTIADRMASIGDKHIASQRMIANVRIRVEGDRARAVAAFRSTHFDLGATETHAHEGWFLSELVRTAQGWRFARLKRIKSLREVLNTTPEGRAVRDEVYRWVP